MRLVSHVAFHGLYSTLYLILLKAAAACWQPMPDAEPPSILLSMMSGSFQSLRVRNVQARQFLNTIKSILDSRLCSR
jgi:hypothetical protein